MHLFTFRLIACHLFFEICFLVFQAYQTRYFIFSVVSALPYKLFPFSYMKRSKKESKIMVAILVIKRTLVTFSLKFNSLVIRPTYSSDSYRADPTKSLLWHLYYLLTRLLLQVKTYLQMTNKSNGDKHLSSYKRNKKKYPRKYPQWKKEKKEKLTISK